VTLVSPDAATTTALSFSSDVELARWVVTTPCVVPFANILVHLTYKLSLRGSVMRVGAPRATEKESLVPIKGLGPDLFLSFPGGVHDAILDFEWSRSTDFWMGREHHRELYSIYGQ
jgi:hypothetical protein